MTTTLTVASSAVQKERSGPSIVILNYSAKPGPNVPFSLFLSLMQPTDPDKFTAKAWDAIVEAQDVARRFRQQYLEVEHVTLAMLEQAGLAGHHFDQSRSLS